MQRISVIGLGAMGSVLAKTLLAAGFDVTVWNRSPGKAENLASAGAKIAGTVPQAISASEATIFCIKSHSDTLQLLKEAPAELEGATIIELSTGGAPEATALAKFLSDARARCLIGMIATFPVDIGKTDAAIVTVGAEAAWEDCKVILKALGGASVYIGENPAALAALYAALVLPRQGFMFGMIYGAALFEKLGIPVESYVQQLPLTLKVTHDYCDVFAATVPNGAYDNPPAALGMYAAALEDVLATFGEAGVRDELPRLLSRLMQEGIDAGQSDQHLTSLVKTLRG